MGPARARTRPRGPPLVGNRLSRRLVSIAALLSLCAVSACGGGGGGGSLTDAAVSFNGQDSSAGQQAQGQAAGQGETGVIRFAIPPDPLWDWLNNSGSLAEWEQTHGVRVDASHPFDQFGAFVGGHADIVLINAMNVPTIVEQSQREAVILGKYTYDRSFIGVGRYSLAQTLADLGGMRIAVYSTVDSTLLWGVIADALHELEFRTEEGDFELVVADAASTANLVTRGDVDACICLPDFSVGYLSDGDLKPLYGGRSAAQVFSDEVAEDLATRSAFSVIDGAVSGFDVEAAAEPIDALPLADTFVADKEWYEQNPNTAAAFLSLWEEGLHEWQVDKPALVNDYQHHFSIQGSEEIDWLLKYLADHDWIASSVFVTTGEATTQSDTFAHMKRAGLIAEDLLEPEIVDSLASDDAEPQG